MTKRYPLILMLIIVSFQTLHAQESTDTTSADAIKSNLEILEEEDLGKRDALYIIPFINSRVGGSWGDVPGLYISTVNAATSIYLFDFAYEYKINSNFFLNVGLALNLLIPTIYEIKDRPSKDLEESLKQLFTAITLGTISPFQPVLYLGISYTKEVKKNSPWHWEVTPMIAFRMFFSGEGGSVS